MNTTMMNLQGSNMLFGFEDEILEGNHQMSHSKHFQGDGGECLATMNDIEYVEENGETVKVYSSVAKPESEIEMQDIKLEEQDPPRHVSVQDHDGEITDSQRSSSNRSVNYGFNDIAAPFTLNPEIITEQKGYSSFKAKEMGTRFDSPLNNDNNNQSSPDGPKSLQNKPSGRFSIAQSFAKIPQAALKGYRASQNYLGGGLQGLAEFSSNIKIPGQTKRDPLPEEQHQPPSSSGDAEIDGMRQSRVKRLDRAVSS